MLPEERFFSKVEVGDCWTWTGGVSNEHGRFWDTQKGHMVPAHRWAWEFLIGPIPADMHIDHCCRNRRCVNPTHLEIVTPQLNSARGQAGKWPRNREVCHAGHVYAEVGRYTTKEGWKGCVQCRRDACRRYRESRRAA